MKLYRSWSKIEGYRNNQRRIQFNWVVTFTAGTTFSPSSLVWWADDFTGIIINDHYALPFSRQNNISKPERMGKSIIRALISRAPLLNPEENKSERARERGREGEREKTSMRKGKSIFTNPAQSLLVAPKLFRYIFLIEYKIPWGSLLHIILAGDY